MSALTALEVRILRRCVGAPQWARSFQTVRGYVDRMIRTGHLERCKPAGGRCANLVRLTAKGGQVIGVKALGLTDRFAERLSQHGDIKRASEECGITRGYGRGIFNRICEQLGEYF